MHRLGSQADRSRCLHAQHRIYTLILQLIYQFAYQPTVMIIGHNYRSLNMPSLPHPHVFDRSVLTAAVFVVLAVPGLANAPPPMPECMPLLPRSPLLGVSSPLPPQLVQSPLMHQDVLVSLLGPSVLI